MGYEEIKRLFQGFPLEIIDVDRSIDPWALEETTIENYRKKLKSGPLGMDVVSESPDLGEGWSVFMITKDLIINLYSSDSEYAHDITGAFFGLHLKEVYGDSELFVTKSGEEEYYVIFGKNIPKIWDLDRNSVINELKTDDSVSVPGPSGVSSEEQG